MKIWDIVDEVWPDVRITEPSRQKARFKGVVSSAVNVVFAVGLAFSTSGSFYIPQRASSSEAAVRVRVALQRNAEGRAASATTRQRAPTSTDTQFGQSTIRLSRNFAAWFQPAPDEPELDDDYSFS
jgi:hypothetical protein